MYSLTVTVSHRHFSPITACCSGDGHSSCPCPCCNPSCRLSAVPCCPCPCCSSCPCRPCGPRHPCCSCCIHRSCSDCSFRNRMGPDQTAETDHTPLPTPEAGAGVLRTVLRTGCRQLVPSLTSCGLPCPCHGPDPLSPHQNSDHGGSCYIQKEGPCHHPYPALCPCSGV